MAQDGYFSTTQTVQSLYSSFTTGSVIFQGSGTALAQNNSNLFWDNVNLRLGIGTNTPVTVLDVEAGYGNVGGMGLTVGGADIVQVSSGAVTFVTNTTGQTFGTVAGNTLGRILRLKDLLRTYSYDLGIDNFNSFFISNSVNLTQALTITTNNYVGIDNQFPAFPLDVVGVAAVTTLYGKNTSQNANDLLYLGSGTNTNFFLDRPNAGNQLVIGYNTPKNTTSSNIFTIYDNSTDKVALLTATSKGSSSGTDMVTVVNLTDTGIPTSASGAPLTITTGQVISSGVYNTETNSSTAITVTTTAGTIGGSTVTPPAGTYLVIFSCNITASSAAGNILKIEISVGGTLQADTTRQIMPTSTGAFSVFQNMSIGTNKITAVNGSQAIAVVASSSAGTITVTGLNFDVVRLA